MSSTLRNQVIFVGDSNVGKTSIIIKYIHNKYGKTSTTVGANLEFVDVNIVLGNNGSVLASNKLVVWDTAGQERYDSCTEQYFEMAEGIILVYDITSMKSFESCAEWKKKVEMHARNVDNLQFVLVGNKLDMEKERKVPTQIAKTFAKNNSMDFIEVCAKDGTGIDEIFRKIATKMFILGLDIEKNKQTGYIETSRTVRGSFKLSRDDFKKQDIRNKKSECPC